MYALEVGAWTSWRSPAAIDPIELRIRNEPDVDPESGTAVGQPAAASNVCETGAERFGWDAGATRTPRHAPRR